MEGWTRRGPLKKGAAREDARGEDKKTARTERGDGRERGEGASRSGVGQRAVPFAYAPICSDVAYRRAKPGRPRRARSEPAPPTRWLLLHVPSEGTDSARAEGEFEVFNGGIEPSTDRRVFGWSGAIRALFATRGWISSPLRMEEAVPTARAAAEEAVPSAAAPTGVGENARGKRRSRRSRRASTRGRRRPRRRRSRRVPRDATAGARPRAARPRSRPRPPPPAVGARDLHASASATATTTATTATAWGSPSRTTASRTFAASGSRGNDAWTPDATRDSSASPSPSSSDRSRCSASTSTRSSSTRPRRSSSAYDAQPRERRRDSRRTHPPRRRERTPRRSPTTTTADGDDAPPSSAVSFTAGKRRAGFESAASDGTL